jgi:hypothetical protein
MNRPILPLRLPTRSCDLHVEALEAAHFGSLALAFEQFTAVLKAVS